MDVGIPCPTCRPYTIFYKLIDEKIKEETNGQMEEKNYLYANITHDLKTPITSILSFVNALKERKFDRVETMEAQLKRQLLKPFLNRLYMEIAQETAVKEVD